MVETNAARAISLCDEFHDKLRFRRPSISMDVNPSFLVRRLTIKTQYRFICSEFSRLGEETGVPKTHFKRKRLLAGS